MRARRSRLRKGARGLAGFAGLLLVAAGAPAQTYHVLEGSVLDLPLSGSFEVSPADLPGPSEPPAVLLVDDFDLAAGAARFRPRGPIQPAPIQVPRLLFSPALVTIADQIQVEGSSVSFARLQAGGPLLSDASTIHYRFFDFRADAGDGGRALGRIGDGPQPRRLEVAGRLVQIDRRFYLPARCDAGGGSINDLDDVIIEFGEFGILPGESVEFTPPGGYVPIGIGRPPGTIGGSLVIANDLLPTIPTGLYTPGDATLIAISPPTLPGNADLIAVSPTLTAPDRGLIISSGSPRPGGVFIAVPGPTLPPLPAPAADARRVAGRALDLLEELGIVAPDGADVTLEGGDLLVTSSGDLIIAAELFSRPELTSITISTPGSVTIEGSVEVPPDLLRIDAGSIVFDTGLPPLPPPQVRPIGADCVPLPLSVTETERGPFSLVATAAQPVAIDVRPRKRNRVRPGSRRVIPVALLGSPELDVRDVLPSSLRLGDGEARPLRLPRHAHLLDVDRDRRLDLVVFFRVRDAEIAYGDTRVCLHGELADGGAVEGCDAVDTRPRRRHRRR